MVSMFIPIYLYYLNSNIYNIVFIIYNIFSKLILKTKRVVADGMNIKQNVILTCIHRLVLLYDAFQHETALNKMTLNLIKIVYK